MAKLRPRDEVFLAVHERMNRTEDEALPAQPAAYDYAADVVAMLVESYGLSWCRTTT